MTNSRVVAARILNKLIQNQGSLSQHLDSYKQLEDIHFIQELTFGSCRFYFSLKFLLNQLLSKPLKKKDHDIEALLIIGLYQLKEMRVPDYAAINETVNAAQQFKKPWAKSLINGVLRNYLRQREDLEQALSAQPPAVRESHPDWLVAEINKSWPGHTESVLCAINCRPPMVLRVNLGKISRDEYRHKLSTANIAAEPGRLSAAALYLEQPQAVEELPGFGSGLISVQDEASQLVAPLLQLEPGLRVLDACAAPGGKTCHILESEHSLTEHVAIDKGQSRVQRIEQNLQRLQLNATVLQADANEVSSWWDGRPFDRILLDAPCSATGVIRRHPDIKLLRRPEHIDSLVEQQITLLKSLWPCLSPGGLLLYTTCSVLARENDSLVAEFLRTTPNAKYESVMADWGVECAHGRQLLPAEIDGPDGFFYSLLRAC